MSNKRIMKWLQQSGGAPLTDQEKEGIWVFINKFLIYIVFIVLYGVAFMHISFWSNFVAFICIFCIHTISGFYILKDIFSNSELMSKLSSSENFGITTDNGKILMVFLVALVIAFIFKLISIAIMIAVFDYARYQTPDNNYNTYDMSGEYRDLVNNYKSSFKRSTMLFLLLAYFILVPRLSPDAQIAIRNCICVIITISILGMCINEIIYANNFLKIKQRHNDLYVVADPTKSVAYNAATTGS
jgi:hypothetical protein